MFFLACLETWQIFIAPSMTKMTARILIQKCKNMKKFLYGINRDESSSLSH